jgi:hypothetical protein
VLHGVDHVAHAVTGLADVDGVDDVDDVDDVNDVNDVHDVNDVNDVDDAWGSGSDTDHVNVLAQPMETDVVTHGWVFGSDHVDTLLLEINQCSDGCRGLVFDSHDLFVPRSIGPGWGIRYDYLTNGGFVVQRLQHGVGLCVFDWTDYNDGTQDACICLAACRVEVLGNPAIRLHLLRVQADTTITVTVVFDGLCTIVPEHGCF